MQAVNSENDRYLNMDNWRQAHLSKQTCKPGHQYNKFGVGNLETLGGKPGAREDLIEFHSKYYSSNIMTLAIVSNHKISKMEEWAVKYFTEIPNNNLPDQVIESHPFGKEELSKFIRMLSLKEKDTLNFYWPLKSYQKHYRKKISGLISYLVGHEGENSLFQVLKDEGLAVSLMCGDSNSLKVMTELEVEIELTNKGFKQ